MRGDDNHGTGEVMDLQAEKGCSYIFSLPTNAHPKQIGQAWCENAPVRRELASMDAVCRFFQANYQAKS